MPILDPYGNPVFSQRKFARAAERENRSTPTLPIYDGDFSKLIPNIDRKIIVSAARVIFQDYGPIKGACIQKADNAVGRAWSPKFTGQDREWGAIAKDWLENQWFGNCDVRGRAWDFKTLLWLDSVAIDRDGDFLIYLTEADSGYPLTQRIPVNRIGQRSHSYRPEKIEDKESPFNGYIIEQGVIRNDKGRAVGFRILGDTIDEDFDVPADRVVHVFDPTWHDQIRGIPAYTDAIRMIYGSMTAHDREQMNQNIRSSIALIEYNEEGGPNIDNPTLTIGSSATTDGDGNITAAAVPTYEAFADGMVRYFRSNSGGKIESVDNNQPGDMWDRFQDRVVRMAMSGLNWPYELTWKGGEINSALVRNIQERARVSVEDRQDVLRNPATFVVRYAIAKAIKVGILPKPKNLSDWWKWDFQMPRKFSIDQGRDAAQRREDFYSGLRNRTEIHGEEGRDAEAMEDERVAEVIRRERKIDEAVAAYEAETGRIIDRRLFYKLGANDQAAPQPTEPIPAE